MFFLGLQYESLLLSSLLASSAEKFTASRPVQPTEKLSAVIAFPDGFSPAWARRGPDRGCNLKAVSAWPHRCEAAWPRRNQTGGVRRYAFEFTWRDLTNLAAAAIGTCRSCHRSYEPYLCAFRARERG